MNHRIALPASALVALLLTACGKADIETTDSLADDIAVLQEELAAAQA